MISSLITSRCKTVSRRSSLRNRLGSDRPSLPNLGTLPRIRLVHLQAYRRLSPDAQEFSYLSNFRSPSQIRLFLLFFLLFPGFADNIVLGYEIQSLVIIISITDAEFWITIAALPITIIILVFCAWSVRHEIIVGMVVAIVLFVGGLAYFLFKAFSSSRRSLILARSYVSTISVLQVHSCTTSSNNFWYH